MARHHVVRILPFSPEQLFDLVGDVAAYPEFVPWVVSMSVGPVKEEGQGITLLSAEAGVGFSFLRERFTTSIKRDANARAIEVRLISGPFKRLVNHWRFEPHDLGAKVVFDIDFEFKSKLLDTLLRANFDRAVDRLIACFEDRAEVLYGQPADTRA